MKRSTLFIIFILFTAFLSTGCGFINSFIKNHQNTDTSENFEINGNTVSFEWGEYVIPDGWEFCEEYTNEKYMNAGKLFFKNAETMNDPHIYTNISVEYGINRYPIREHERFREAVLKQLLSQTAGKKAQVTGSGSYTENGYILYNFTIDEEDENITTTQYYVLGDKEYVLVHLTDYHEQTGDDAQKAAYDFAQSVVWNDYQD